jgi:hypothetical protein
MTWQESQAEAAHRVAALPIPKDGPLDGLVLTLLEFESDELARYAIGLESARDQTYINRAIRRLLKPRGVLFRTRWIKMAATVQWLTEDQFTRALAAEQQPTEKTP